MSGKHPEHRNTARKVDTDQPSTGARHLADTAGPNRPASLTRTAIPIRLARRIRTAS